ncbi:MAG TPA: hypothetical protein P5205_01290 [Candidatus Paceibacterota bacterium]|nr:hypothetical protein [Verrucomicrobiota bacterium]HSA08983.1 hypothetical protein [Candidatus Paceibacterota bacterium]
MARATRDRQNEEGKRRNPGGKRRVLVRKCFKYKTCNSSLVLHIMCAMILMGFIPLAALLLLVAWPAAAAQYHANNQPDSCRVHLVD